MTTELPIIVEEGSDEPVGGDKPVAKKPVPPKVKKDKKKAVSGKKLPKLSPEALKVRRLENLKKANEVRRQNKIARDKKDNKKNKTAKSKASK